MAGYKPKDLKQKFIPTMEFNLEAGVDVNRTPEQKARDLAMVEGKKTPSKAVRERLEKAMEGHEDVV